MGGPGQGSGGGRREVSQGRCRPHLPPLQQHQEEGLGALGTQSQTEQPQLSGWGMENRGGLGP